MAFVLLVSALHQTALAQESEAFDIDKLQVENGTAAELKGVKRIYVVSKLSAARRAKMLEVLEKANLPIMITDDPKEAELTLSFVVTRSAFTHGLKDGPRSPGLIDWRSDNSYTRYQGRGVAYATKGENRIRVLFNFDQRKDRSYYFRPWEMFMKAFIKEYKRANNLR